MEQVYDFRKKLLTLHREEITDTTYVPEDGMIPLVGYAIVVPERCDRVISNAAIDLQQYLRISHSITVEIQQISSFDKVSGKAIVVAPYLFANRSWDKEKTAGAYHIFCEEGNIFVCGFDSRGCAQGVYWLEEEMTRICAPYVRCGDTFHAPMFSPRMVHSGYGLDQFPDAHLSAIAHAGMDAILVFTKGVNQTPTGYLDFNDLIYRAAGYGLDVYAYVYFPSQRHPEDADAFDYYNASYGKLFADCPGLKGVVLVGESVEFPTKDPRASKLTVHNNWVDGVFIGKPTAGWFPCCDYGQWLAMVQKVICSHKPDADIVFWTYNWGYAPEEDRLALIDSLPEGISLMATFEMFEQRQLGELPVATVDYTISFVGPGKYFLSEAKRAKERGIRLYTQANSAGLTWDFGVIPYEPFPMQWAERYDAMREAKQKYGLCGVMESHHFGFWPSFVSRIEKAMFTEPYISAECAIREEAKSMYGLENLEEAIKAWEKLSKGIRYYPSCNEDQYGPFRVGPAYPMVFRSDVLIPTVPEAMFGGNKICFTDYASDALYRIIAHTLGHTGLVQQRIPMEIPLLEKMRNYFYEGRIGLEKILPKLTLWQAKDCEALINLVHFIENCITTTIHVKQWNILRWKTRTETDGRVLLNLMKQMQEIGYAEIANAEDAIPLAQMDSRLGWEPSMEYIGGVRHLRWKIQQTRQVIEEEIPGYMRMTLMQGQKDASESNAQHSKMTTAIIACLDNDVGESVKLQDIANQFSYSLSSIRRIFKKETGLSVVDYQNNMRIIRSKRLLEDSNISIEEIAGLLGFANASYFSKTFRKQVGISPSAYRKQVKKSDTF